MDDARHSREPYVQMGLYKWAFKDGWSPKPDVSEVTLFMDEIRFGTDRASLEDFLLSSQSDPRPSPSPSMTASPSPKPSASPKPSPTPTSASGCVNVNQNSYANASCPAGQTISAISFASYGTPNGSCGSFRTSGCHAANSRTIVQTSCLNRANCSVAVGDWVFGDPCSGVGKRLYVQYTCQ